MTFNGLIETILCLIFLSFGVFFVIAYDAAQKPEPVLNQSQAYEVVVGRDFQEPYILHDKGE